MSDPTRGRCPPIYRGRNRSWVVDKARRGGRVPSLFLAAAVKKSRRGGMRRSIGTRASGAGRGTRRGQGEAGLFKSSPSPAFYSQERSRRSPDAGRSRHTPGFELSPGELAVLRFPLPAASPAAPGDSSREREPEMFCSGNQDHRLLLPGRFNVKAVPLNSVTRNSNAVI